MIIKVEYTNNTTEEFTAINDIIRKSDIKSVDMSNMTINKIPKQAFSGCSSLETVIFPQGLQEVGDSAFEGCSSITCLLYTSPSPRD